MHSHRCRGVPTPRSLGECEVPPDVAEVRPFLLQDHAHAVPNRRMPVTATPRIVALLVEPEGLDARGHPGRLGCCSGRLGNHGDQYSPGTGGYPRRGRVVDGPDVASPCAGDRQGLAPRWGHGIEQPFHEIGSTPLTTRLPKNKSWLSILSPPTSMLRIVTPLTSDEIMVAPSNSSVPE